MSDIEHNSSEDSDLLEACLYLCTELPITVDVPNCDMNDNQSIICNFASRLETEFPPGFPAFSHLHAKEPF